MSMSDFEEALQFLSPSRIKDIAVERPNVKWADIGGLRSEKETMRRMIENPLLHRAAFEEFESTGSRGCILWGPPGTGKTMMAKAIASECNANFLYIKGPELLSPYHGGSEQRVREYFEKARAVAPTIMFFDELDALAPKRGSAGNATSDRVVNQLLSEMDGIQRRHQDTDKELYFLGATNRPDIIDDALRRPGRMEQMVMVDLPDAEGRRDIFRKILSKIPADRLGVDLRGAATTDDEKQECPLEDLVLETEGYSGADINGVVQNAIDEAVNMRIAQRDCRQLIDVELLLKSRRKGTASVSAAERKKYSKWKLLFGSAEQRDDAQQNKGSAHSLPKEAQRIKDFVVSVFGKGERAKLLFEFLVDPDRGAFETLDDVLSLKSNQRDLDDLCEDAGLKHGNKVKFIRALKKE